jgi:hypothetical protein
MNKLIEIVYKLKLKNVENRLTKNEEEIKTCCNYANVSLDNIVSDNVKNSFEYNHLRLEHLRLMSCRSYLENKLTHSNNKK